MSPVTKIYMLDIMTDICVIQTGKAQRAFIRLLQVLEAHSLKKHRENSTNAFNPQSDTETEGK